METQKIVLFGPTTRVGERIMKEALSRGHKVTAITNDVKKVTTHHPNLTLVDADIMNKNDIGSRIKGHDTVISAYEIKSDPAEHVRNLKNLIDVMNNDDIRQLVITGHPGSKETEPNLSFPTNTEGWKKVAEAQKKVREALEEEKRFRWSYIHYPEIENTLTGTGKFTLGSKLLVKSPESEQWVPVKDFSQAVLNEAEHFAAAHTEL